MATQTVSAAQAALRLECLQRLCSQIATSINCARRVLRSNSDDAEAAYLVADALDRLGWMADRATAVAGSGGVLVGGDADGWVLDSATQEMLGKVKTEVSHG